MTREATVKKVQPVDVGTIYKIASETLCDLRTIRKFLKGEHVREATALRIEAGLRRLRLPNPRRAA